MKRHLPSALDNASSGRAGRHAFVERNAAIYKAAYFAGSLLPARNPRETRRRARAFAEAAVAVVSRHSALAISLVVNLALVLLLAMVTIIVRDGGEAAAMSLDLGNFPVENKEPAPPAGGSTAAGRAALDKAVQTMLAAPAAPETEIAAVTTTASASVSYEVRAPSSVNAPAPVALPAAAALGNPRGSGAGGSQDASGLRGRGGGIGGGDGTGAGTFPAAGHDLPLGEKIWLIVDSSGSMERHTEALARAIREHAETSWRNKVPTSRAIDSVLLETIREGIKKKYRVIVWITDLEDDRRLLGAYSGSSLTDKPEAEIGYEDEFARGLKELEQILTDSHTRLFITSVRQDPLPALDAVVKSSGGHIAVLP